MGGRQRALCLLCARHRDAIQIDEFLWFDLDECLFLWKEYEVLYACLPASIAELN